MVILTEVALVVILSALCLQYVMVLRRREKAQQIQADTEMNPTLTIQLKPMNTDDDEIITAVMHDILILGRNIHITHIAFPNDMTVSSQHCRLVFCNGKMFLEDLYSKNGTYLNGNKISKREQLQSGDYFQLGKVELCITFQI